MKIKYPDITVKLVGNDGNVFVILGAVTKALRKNHISETEINQFIDEATSGDYDNLLQTCMKWVNVE